ncbi:hypothetical protein [Pedobacter chitinilyticus]|uniref:Uncharacterized protein n=1 Tax=Pedobacter chitinilyticus TaxID=2233776 RepID=A0A443YJF2_9SPHI|nr:hypothetical protein [Pedobacter chitinilyticus]RWU03889.1 hypothetical protein DPV69_19580 [Pedobacter chitinilyticus]
MLKFLSQDDWIVKMKSQRKLFFNEQPKVVDALVHKHSCTAEYIVFEKKGRVAISFLALVKSKNIISPIHFFYSALWIDPMLGDTKYCEYVSDFLRMLQLQFKKIDIRLSPSIEDVRPFLWAGFSIDNRFTYIKRLDKLEYAKDVHKNIEKSSNATYLYKQELLNKEILDINLRIFLELKLYSKKSINKIKDLITQLSSTEYLTCFSCYFENQLLVSHILFLDKENKIAYTVLKNKQYKEQSGSLHSVLYHHLFIYLKSQGFEYVDLLGANMEPISLFKSRFKADLHTANIVRYSKTRVFFDIVYKKITYLIKRTIVIARS